MKKTLAWSLVIIGILTITVFSLVGSQQDAVADDVVELKHFNWRPEDLEKWGKVYDEFQRRNGIMMKRHEVTTRWRPPRR